MSALAPVGIVGWAWVSAFVGSKVLGFGYDWRERRRERHLEAELVVRSATGAPTDGIARELAEIENARRDEPHWSEYSGWG